MNSLDWIVEIINWSVIVFVFTRTIGTGCFSGMDWILTLSGLLFAYFVRFVNRVTVEN